MKKTAFGPAAARLRAFTLIELLVVIGIIAVLMTLFVSVNAVVQEKMRVSTAEAQLARLSSALDEYKQTYGDYPWVETDDGNQELYQALIGSRRPTSGFRMAGGSLTGANDDLETKRGKAFINPSNFETLVPPTASADDGETSLDTNTENKLIDPWGSPYVYRYKRLSAGGDGSEWEVIGYVLMSHGPDQEKSVMPPDDGDLDNFKNNDAVRDNLFSQSGAF